MKKPEIPLIKIFTLVIVVNLFGSCNNQIALEEELTKRSLHKIVLNPEAPPETMQFGQFVGIWECQSEDLIKNNDGSYTWFTNKSFWKWEYVLGGYAILNQWWQEDTSPKALTPEYFMTGIFIYNPNSKLWEVAVTNSRPRKILSNFRAIYTEGQIQIQDSTRTWLITFFDITQDSFKWKYETIDKKDQKKVISKIFADRILTDLTEN